MLTALKKIFSPPLFLAAGAAAFLGYQYLTETHWMESHYPDIYEALQSIGDPGADVDAKALEARQAGLVALLEYIDRDEGNQSTLVSMTWPSQTSEMRKYNENGDEVHDCGCTEICVQIILNERKQSANVLASAFRLLRNILKSVNSDERFRRDALIRRGMIEHVARIVTFPQFKGYDVAQPNQLYNVKYHGVRLLRSLTMFDRYLKKLVEEIPVGSQGCSHLADLGDATWEGLFAMMEEQGMLQSLVGTIGHCCERAAGADRMSKLGAVRRLVRYVGAGYDKFTRKNALVAISNILRRKVAADVAVVSDLGVLQQVLSAYNNKLHSKAREAILKIMFAVVASTKSAPQDVRDGVANVFVTYKDSSTMLFMLAMHHRYTLKTIAKNLLEILTESQPGEEYSALHRVVIEECEKLAYESKERSLKQQAMKKRAAMLRKMGIEISPRGMPGGAGPVGTPAGGVGGVAGMMMMQ